MKTLKELIKTVKNNLGKHNNYYSNQSTAQLTFNLITHIAQIFGNSMDLDYENQDVLFLYSTLILNQNILK